MTESTPNPDRDDERDQEAETNEYAGSTAEQAKAHEREMEESGEENPG
jgi:hypothetical protein